MPAEVYVRVPDDARIDRWLRRTSDRFSVERTVLAVANSDEPDPPAPIDDLLTTASVAEIVWEWDADRRLLSHGDCELEVNYGLDDWFSDLATALRTAGWGYHFQSDGKYELSGECWEWMPGWPNERTFVQSGESKALDACGLRAALTEAHEHGLDPAEHVTAMLAAWPGWNTPDPP